MKLVKTGLALLLAFAGFGSIRAQTSDEIISKYLDAIGGKDKLLQVKTLYMENTSQVMGNEGPSTVTIVNGVGYKIVSEINGQSFIQVFTDKGGWQVNPYAGAATPTALPEDLFKQGKSKLDYFPLVNYAAKGNKVELLGKEGSAFKLKITGADSSETMVFIDTATYYMTKLTSTASMMGQTMEVTSNFSNFKKADLGIVFPFSSEISYGGQFNITVTVNKIELNKKIDPSVFDMPKS
jgi:outer membrane lipoprotein-sorting protein